MAAVTHAQSLTSSSDLDTYTTAAFTPAANDLLVLKFRIGGTAVTPTCTSSSGLAFTRVGFLVGNPNANHIYIATTLATATSMTISVDVTGDTGTGIILAVERVSGMTLTGANAMRQLAEGDESSGTTPNAVFASAVLTENPTIGMVGASQNGLVLTPPTNWTEVLDAGHATPNSGVEVVTRDSGFTGTTVTWGSTLGVNWQSAVVELDTSAGGQPARKRFGGIPFASLNRGVW